MTRKGFTLIELLIVVAIIAILAAIAVPNFLEAQTRAKISRTYADLRTYATACESYHIDHNKYPIWLENGNKGAWHFDAVRALIPLSTPISYIASSYIPDTFQSMGRAMPGWPKSIGDHYVWAYYLQLGNGSNKAVTFAEYFMNASNTSSGIQSIDAACIWSLGPGSTHSTPEWALYNHVRGDTDWALDQIYDSSNGTVSHGSIVRYMGETRGLNVNFK